MRVVVVGASAAGVATADALRRKGFDGDVTLVGAEGRLPYDRPPLSKQVLAGTWEPDRARLRDVDARLLLGDPAVALDVAERVVRTAGGVELRADAVVVATGVRPRTLPGQERLKGVHVLRTLDDSLALRADLVRAARVVVVGDGVLGAETAATARGMGLDVTVVGPLRAPLELQLGLHAAEVLGGLHVSRGVRLVRAAVSGLVGEDRVRGVALASGEELPADVVVVALGAVPNTEWLADSGLVLDNGVVCDARCRAADGVYAVGDVARWRHERLGTIRLENRTNATEQAVAVADNILGEDRVYAPVPFFWTDQFDARIHLHGVPGDEVEVVEGDVGERRFAAVHRRGGAVVGVLGWNMPKQARQLRTRLLG
ncbi:NAD(P)/FAD-dependent oxidoreductase [Saccharothrix variisporea]|uniref:3-phenylpropionate/trans-cinnamate dioxygenase ferredoxin reductase subunit n=1 Tax=Saccharothrix variisporea TaxID=543527 RepID=A0A495X0Q7_9PSEU|nr:FAD-dependent oxidoreductase [Saccharothrix variisporea]RKT67249.1 3-phenylpropionate/trans-cinnamate dioxygenase ferredoxin reductase subunit [Saccharothrix variisporea]